MSGTGEIVGATVGEPTVYVGGGGVTPPVTLPVGEAVSAVVDAGVAVLGRVEVDARVAWTVEVAETTDRRACRGLGSCGKITPD